MTFSCMFSFCSRNAQAQIPPRGSFIQKCRFALGEWLSFRGSDACPAHGLLLGVPSTLGCLLQALFWAGDKGSCAACVGALGKQHGARGYCWSWLSHSAALGWGGHSAHLVPLLQCDGLLLSQPSAVSCLGPCCASSCASSCSTPFRLP